MGEARGPDFTIAPIGRHYTLPRHDGQQPCAGWKRMTLVRRTESGISYGKCPACQTEVVLMTTDN